MTAAVAYRLPVLRSKSRCRRYALAAIALGDRCEDTVLRVYIPVPLGWTSPCSDSMTTYIRAPAPRADGTPRRPQRWLLPRSCAFPSRCSCESSFIKVAWAILNTFLTDLEDEYARHGMLWKGPLAPVVPNDSAYIAWSPRQVALVTPFAFSNLR